MDASSSFGLASAKLLDKIDKLFACNAGDLVDLPQLVVIGHQSSGKSSVLEALTRLPFPRDSGLCTRFATQISFRRSPTTAVSASIKPSADSSEERLAKLKAWTMDNITNLDQDCFAEIMREVTTLMEIGAGEGQGLRTFSNDVLQLVISGPQQEHFSVIDVPGVFKRTTQGVTTKADIKMVEQMVHGYMSNSRSVMLVVIPCNVDIATQEILEKAEDIDPAGIRTFGILTKPDLVDRGGESSAMDVMEGKTHRLQLGWHMLRNPGQLELSTQLQDRGSVENDFFSTTEPWNQLDSTNVGIDALRSRLQDILTSHIRREFPKVKSEVKTRLNTANSTLQRLGPSRSSESQQREFLMKIAIEYQRLADEAVRNDYSRNDIFLSNRRLRLANEVVNRGQMFADDVADYGHTFDFALDDAIDTFRDDDEADTKGIQDSPNSSELRIRGEEDHPDTADLVFAHDTVPYPREGNILAWMKQEYQRNRGFELGTFDPKLLALVFRYQASKWPAFALGYISDVITVVHDFINKILQDLAPSPRVHNGLLDILKADLELKYRKAMEHTRFLLRVELEGIPATFNHYFGDVLEVKRDERRMRHLKEKVLPDCKHGEVVRLSDLKQSHPLSNVNHTVLEVHDILHAYYKVARKRFVDCVRMQVADNLLVTGPTSPLNVLSAMFVATMSPAQLEEVAGEDLAVVRKRAGLEKEIGKLEEARKILG